MTSVYTTSIADCRLDLTFIVDSSGSINYPTDWDKSKQFVADVVREFDIGPYDVQVAFVLFSAWATVEWDFTENQDKQTLTNEILGMRYRGGGTNLYDALKLTRTEVYTQRRGARNGALRAAIILTDGDVGTRQTIQTATLCKNDGIWLMAVGVTEHVNVAGLHEIISSPSDYYPVDDALPTIVKSIKSKICPEISK